MRPTLDLTLMETAFTWSLRGTCSRLQVGAVLARNGRSISRGYNGAPEGMEHCQHDPQSQESCRVSVHAEMNAIAYAARYGASTDGTSLYITHAPCYTCSGAIISAGINRVVWASVYGDWEGLNKLKMAGIKCHNWKELD